MQDWKAADSRVTDTMNEAKDNVKFLDILETLCSPLYDGNPVSPSRVEKNTPIH